MAAEEFKRKLSAILSADVKGYSRLMGKDEDATVRAITAQRKVITSVIQKHRGRVADPPELYKILSAHNPHGTLFFTQNIVSYVRKGGDGER